MCQALKEMMQESRNDGIQQGSEQGIEQGIRQGIQEAYKDLIIKKLAKNRTPVQIADELELELSEVQKMIDTIQKD